MGAGEDSVAGSESAVGCGAGDDERPIRRDVREGGAAVDRSGAAPASVAVTGSVLDPQRADAGGAVGVQPLVPLVRGIEHERTGVESRGVFQESRALVGWGCGARVVCLRGGTGT